jgi:tetratricopeptide (TPR) repeat protein
MAGPLGLTARLGKALGSRVGAARCCMCACLRAFRASPTRFCNSRRAASGGDLDGAIRAYRDYLAVEPDSVQARSNLGAALARAGRYDEAIAEYDRALQKSPDNPACC